MSSVDEDGKVNCNDLIVITLPSIAASLAFGGGGGQKFPTSNNLLCIATVLTGSIN